MSVPLIPGPHFHDGGYIITRYMAEDNRAHSNEMPKGWYFYCYDKVDNLNLHFKWNGSAQPFENEVIAQLGYAKRKHAVHWQKTYQRAVDNMPARYRTKKYWVDHPKGTVPIGDFIKGQANGIMRIGYGGAVFEHVTKKIPYAQKSLCREIIGIKSGMNFNSNLNYGHEPRDKNRKAMLLLLASDEGTGYAWEKICQWKRTGLYKEWVKLNNWP